MSLFYNSIETVFSLSFCWWSLFSYVIFGERKKLKHFMVFVLTSGTSLYWYITCLHTHDLCCGLKLTHISTKRLSPKIRTTVIQRIARQQKMKITRENYYVYFCTSCCKPPWPAGMEIIVINACALCYHFAHSVIILRTLLSFCALCYQLGPCSHCYHYVYVVEW